MRRGVASGRGVSDEYDRMRGDDLGLAMLIAESEGAGYEPVGVVGSLNEAVAVARDDLGVRVRALEGGGTPLCPDEYALWTRSIDGEYVRSYGINPTTFQLNTEGAIAVPTPACSSVCVPRVDVGRLVITADGFINLGQVCEYRLLYADVMVSDLIDGISVTLANGSSYQFRENDPGFAVLVEYLEEDGYVISTGPR